MMNQEKIQELVSRSQQDDKRAFRKTACQPGFTKSPVTPVTTVCVRYAILRWIMNPPFPIR